MEYRAEENDAGKRRPDARQRRRAGRVLGVIGILLAVLAASAAVFTTDLGSLGIVEAVAGVSLGVIGYFLGSRFFGNAAVMTGLAALFIGFSAAQNLF